MADNEKRIDQLAEEATTLAAGDFFVAQRIADGETVKINVENAAATLAPTATATTISGRANAEGAGAQYARADHSHAIALTTQSIDSADSPYALAAETGALVVDTTAEVDITLPDPSTVTALLPVLIVDATNNSSAKRIRLTAHVGGVEIDGSAAAKDLAVDGGRWWLWTPDGLSWITAPCLPPLGLATTTEPGQMSATDKLSLELLVSLAGAQAPITESGTTRALSDADHGKVFLCTHASGCTITVPDTVSPGLTVMVRQRGAGQVTIQGSGAMVVTPAPTFLVAANTARTAELGSAAVVSVDSATVCSVDGDLEAA